MQESTGRALENNAAEPQHPADALIVWAEIADQAGMMTFESGHGAQLLHEFPLLSNTCDAYH